MWLYKTSTNSARGPPGMRFPPVYSGIRGARSLILCVVFCRSLFVLLFFFIWSLYCMSFDLQLLITPLVREVINLCGYIKHQRILRGCLLFNVNQHILGIFMTRT
jgi:hypothetical protein